MLTRKSVSEWAGGSTRRSAAQPGRVEGFWLGDGWLWWGLEIDFLAGELLELTDEITLAALLTDP